LILEVNMKLLEAVVLFSLVLVTNSCTVIGIFADTAIQSVANDNIERRTGYRNEIEPFFTRKGFEQDVKLIKMLIAKLPDKKMSVVSQKINQEPVLVCMNVPETQQKCYSAEYYKNMYITDSFN
jgi:hypothetical protein